MTPDANIDWNGDCVEGAAEGSGSLVVSLGSQHTALIGVMVKGVLTGPGKIEFFNNAELTGTFSEGWIIGDVTYKKGPEYTYTGGWRILQPEGSGHAEWANGIQYTGQWHNGEYNGRGKLTQSNGDVYEGQFADNLPNGVGSVTSSTGVVISGEWMAGRPKGVMKMTYPGMATYVGGVADGQREGGGDLQCASGSSFVGMWTADVPQGAGTLSAPGGMQVAGVWDHGSLTLNDRLIEMRGTNDICQAAVKIGRNQTGNP